MHGLLVLPGPNHAAHTTRILQPLNTSLAAASLNAEVWIMAFPDRGTQVEVCAAARPHNQPPGPLCPCSPARLPARGRTALPTPSSAPSREENLRGEKQHVVCSSGRQPGPRLPQGHPNSPSAPIAASSLGQPSAAQTQPGRALYLPKEAPNHGFLAHSRHTALRCGADTRSFSSIKHWYCWSSACIRVPNTPLPAATA